MNQKFVFLTTVRLNHRGHIVQIELGVRSYMSRRNDMLQNEKMREALRLLMQYGSKGRGYQKKSSAVHEGIVS